MISQKQRKILAFPYSKYDALICDGAVRSGKTSLMMVAFVDWAMREFSGQRFGICGKTVDSASKNIVVPFISMSRAKKLYTLRWRRSDKILEVSRGPVKNYFEVFGGKDESSFMLIQGRTLAGVLLDEVALMPESFFNQALARCSVDGAKLWFSCNPDNPQHWFYTNWIQKHKERNALYLHFEMTDNPSLSEKTLERYKTQYTGVFYDRYIRGLWVPAEGVIYRLFADNPQKFLWPQDKPLRLQQLYIGVDFGGNGSQHAFVAVGVLPGYAGVVALASRRIDAKGTDEAYLSKTFLEFAEMVFSSWGEIHAVFCDSAEQVLKNSLRSAALRSRFAWLADRIYNSKKSEITDRIRLTSILMGSGRFWYLPGAQTLRDALAAALWSGKHPGVDERLDDGTTDVDTLDAFEYAIERDYKRYLRLIP